MSTYEELLEVINEDTQGMDEKEKDRYFLYSSRFICLRTIELVATALASPLEDDEKIKLIFLALQTGAEYLEPLLINQNIQDIPDIENFINLKGK